MARPRIALVHLLAIAGLFWTAPSVAQSAHPASNAGARIHIATENYPPFNMMVGDHIGGLATDLVRDMFARAGISYTIEMLPWERAYAMALSHKDTCVYSTAVTDGRQPLFEWVGPLVSNDWVLFARAGRHLDIKALADAKPYRIGAYLGDAASDYLARAGYRIDVVPHDALNVRKLEMGRIDLWATGSSVAPYLARQADVTDIVPILTFKQNVMSLACNKDTDPAVLTTLRKELLAIRKAS
jgi:polar amino acid transport system substrate-binding protein